MLPKLEYGHLYKFAVSVGLLLLGLSVALPWLVLRESSVLLITKDQLDDLTPRAQRVIQDKQADYEWVVDNYAIASGLAALSGVGLTSYGFFKWRARQGVADELEDTQRDTAKAQLHQMTPREIEEKLDREAAETIREAEPDERDDVEPATAARTRALDYTAVRSEISVIEDLVLRGLRSAFSSTHSVHSNVGVNVAARRISLDAVLLPEEAGTPPYVVEIKLIRSPIDLRSRVERTVTQAAQAALATGHFLETEVRGIAVVVVDAPETSIVERRVGSASRSLDELSGILAVPVAGLVLTRDELEKMAPDTLRTAIESQFAG